ncbi:hypothetical protein [Bradyrhizobium sp. JYMT SZCCT0180]|uniref:hypothetical protein n=1 Tax=Bradyrhizobium sp. JYMT SZCCT0180 TaxID=2807666 RepID=UPI001BA7B04F|nr:hypothetical protein [Bradyrhizobium sp. JYMT SZCCT0180]MBR1212792.1 hypothetical protein [Bradyrhizobium sp. JYMT SZCCT0180]
MQIDPAFGLLTTDEAISRATKQVVASALGSAGVWCHLNPRPPPELLFSIT